MHSSKKLARTALILCAVVGTLALVAAVIIATTAAGAKDAFAAAKPAASGVLGIGAEITAPVSAPVTTAEKVPSAEATAVVPVMLLHAASRAAAPLPPAVKRVATKSARIHTASRPRKAFAKSVSGSGWRSARCSWYGPGFYGHTMAGGGQLTPTSMIVASRTLPFGTRIQFSYHGRTCIAVVKDRGPYVYSRLFDLGPGTAHALGFSGVATVQYRILGK